ncbi:hypothetical protein DFH29DRAFT_1084075 [Suillus ampliporus]|nr:hypothetical protein DFH29DRAFT_1084075 [Suillus ampliporus]
MGKLTAIHASSIFTCFLRSNRASLVRGLAALLSPAPGSIAFGTHGGLPKQGIIWEDVLGEKVEVYCHDPESWNKLWEEAGPFKMDTILEEVTDLEGGIAWKMTFHPAQPLPLALYDCHRPSDFLYTRASISFSVITQLYHIPVPGQLPGGLPRVFIDHTPLAVRHAMAQNTCEPPTPLARMQDLHCARQPPLRVTFPVITVGEVELVHPTAKLPGVASQAQGSCTHPTTEPSVIGTLHRFLRRFLSSMVDYT